jgi:hypothetical protein
MLLSTNTTNQKGFKAVQEVKARTGLVLKTSLSSFNLGQKKTSVCASVLKKIEKNQTTKTIILQVRV